MILRLRDTLMLLMLLKNNFEMSIVDNVASIAQWQSTGLVNQGSRVQSSLEALIFFINFGSIMMLHFSISTFIIYIYIQNLLISNFGKCTFY